MTKTIRIIIGLLISGFCLWLVFRGFDSASLKKSLQEAHYAWLIPAVFIFILNQSLRTIRWSLLLSPIKKVSPASLFPVLNAGFFMNMVLPARAGEVVRAFAAHRRYELNMGSVLGSIVIERFSDLLGLFVIILLAFRILPHDTIPVGRIAGLLICGGLFIVFLLVFAQKQKEKINKLSGLWRKGFEFLIKISDGFIALKSIKKMSSVGVLSLLIWFNEAFYLLIMAQAMNMGLGFFHATAVIVGISIGVMIPAAPGFIGTYEFFATQMLQFLGYQKDISLSFVLFLHFTQVVMFAILGITSLFLLRRSLAILPPPAEAAAS